MLNETEYYKNQRKAHLNQPFTNFTQKFAKENHLTLHEQSKHLATSSHRDKLLKEESITTAFAYFYPRTAFSETIQFRYPNVRFFTEQLLLCVEQKLPGYVKFEFSGPFCHISTNKLTPDVRNFCFLINQNHDYVDNLLQHYGSSLKPDCWSQRNYALHYNDTGK